MGMLSQFEDKESDPGSGDGVSLEKIFAEIADFHDVDKYYKDLILTLRRKNDCQTAISKILEISLSPVDLVIQLELILDLVLGIEWLTLEHKGAVFLQDGEKGLRMIVHRNLSTSLVSMCQKLDYGQCLCGRAAQTRQIVFKSCLDHDHENMPAGITEHGHYVIPFVFNQKTLGVLNLYVKHGHVQTEEEVEFLSSCGRIISSIIHRKQIEEKTIFLSYHDELTGLPNRRYLFSEIENNIHYARRYKICFAVLFIDLDYFKRVNDTLGHQYGDAILKQVSTRLTKSIRKCDFAERNGGDEFVVLLKNVDDIETIRMIGNKIIKNLANLYVIEGKVIEIGASIGVSLYPNQEILDEDIDGLVRMADMALYGAKSKRGSLVISGEGPACQEKPQVDVDHC